MLVQCTISELCYSRDNSLMLLLCKCYFSNVLFYSCMMVKGNKMAEILHHMFSFLDTVNFFYKMAEILHHMFSCLNIVNVFHNMAEILHHMFSCLDVQ